MTHKYYSEHRDLKLDWTERKLKIDNILGFASPEKSNFQEISAEEEPSVLAR